MVEVITDMITELFKKHNGYLHTKDLQGNRQQQYHLQKMVKEGVVYKLKRGLYKHPYYATLSPLQEVSLMYPKAVICMHSACIYYNLTTYMPHVNHLAIRHKQKLTLADFPPVKLYYWLDDIFSQHIVEQNNIRIYSLERTVCDVIKYNIQMGQDMVKEVAENYLDRKERNIELLLKTAQEINAYNKVHQIFSILI